MKVVSSVVVSAPHCQRSTVCVSDTWAGVGASCFATVACGAVVIPYPLRRLLANSSGYHRHLVRQFAYARSRPARARASYREGRQFDKRAGHLRSIALAANPTNSIEADNGAKPGESHRCLDGPEVPMHATKVYHHSQPRAACGIASDHVGLDLLI